jgi:hypothetical protein
MYFRFSQAEFPYQQSENSFVHGTLLFSFPMSYDLASLVHSG